jgi:cation:H+ antiporter
MTLAAFVVSFLVSGIIVVVAGTVLARNGDRIAARTNLGGLWVGSVLLALATSLPEIVTDIASIRIGADDLAAGDLFGSSMANMLILALIALIPSGVDVFRKATLDHALYASLAIVMTSIATVTILMRPTRSVIGVGFGSILLLVTYAAGSRAVYHYSALARKAAKTVEMSAVAAEGADGKPMGAASLRRPIAAFAAASAVILIAAPQFAVAANGIAVATGISTAFMGTWLVGLATSLPELVTSLAAVRLRAYDLAVGNLFGSNALNMSIFVLLDIAHGPGPFLGAVSEVHAISGLTAIALMGIAVAGVVYRAKGKQTLVEPTSGLIIVGYVFGLAMVFMRSSVM